MYQQRLGHFSFIKTAKVAILVMDDMGMMTCGFALGGATGVQSIDFSSPENERVPSVFVPSFFWYLVELLSGAMPFPWNARVRTK